MCTCKNEVGNVGDVTLRTMSPHCTCPPPQGPRRPQRARHSLQYPNQLRSHSIRRRPHSIQMRCKHEFSRPMAGTKQRARSMFIPPSFEIDKPLGTLLSGQEKTAGGSSSATCMTSWIATNRAAVVLNLSNNVGVHEEIALISRKRTGVKMEMSSNLVAKYYPASTSVDVVSW
jgi:hypothetical protein